MPEKRDPWLIARLFDLGFTHFVALSLIRIVYVLLMVAGLVGLGFGVTYLFQIGQSDTNIVALLVVLLGPVIYFVYLIVLRLICETLIVAFVIAENIEQVRVALQQPPTRDTPQQPS